MYLFTVVLTDEKDRTFCYQLCRNYVSVITNSEENVDIHVHYMNIE